MTSESEEMVTFRLAPRDRAAIQRLLQSGEFRNRSDFLRYAVKSTLAVYGEAPKAQPLDLQLEAVELPAHEPARARARGRTSRKGMDL